MLMSAVVDPSAFDKEYFSIPGYREQAEMFFRGIRSNGVIIVDPEGRLKTGLFDAIDSLPTKFNQQLGILLAELSKKEKRKKKFISCHPKIYMRPSKRSLSSMACHLKSACEIDSLIVSNRMAVESAAKELTTGDGIVALEKYSSSEFERRRSYYMEDFPPIDQLSESDVTKAIVRSIKFTRWIRIYDRQIGTGNNTSHFRQGIEYILDLWRRHGHFASLSEGNVEIFTCQKEHPSIDDPPSVQTNKAESNKKASQKVEFELLKPLKEKFPWQIELRVKEDSGRIFHARYLETQCVIVLFDRGFDLFGPGKAFKRNIVKVDNGSFKHLRECRNLQDTKFV